MKRGTLIELYEKERAYEEKVFGVYGENKSFNVASFLQFIESSLNKAKKSYTEKWETELPSWLEDSTEFIEQGSSPTETYAYLIKIFALCGAALEQYTIINVDEWRKDFEINKKWLED